MSRLCAQCELRCETANERWLNSWHPSRIHHFNTQTWARQHELRCERTKPWFFFFCYSRQHSGVIVTRRCCSCSCVDSYQIWLFRFGDVSNTLSVKHQKLKAGKWKVGGYETGIIIKANLCIAFCTPGKTVPRHLYCVFWWISTESRVIFAFKHLICEQYCGLASSLSGLILH